MIVSFSVANFRSFSSEETLSLVASDRLAGGHDDHAVAIPDSEAKVLRTAVLYGANGAGKSNLFKALRYLQAVALQPRERNSGTGRERFRFNGEADGLSGFDLQFITEGKLYRFGLKLDDQRIAEEWLVRIIGGREKPLYERTTSADGKVMVDAPGLKPVGAKLTALATVGGPQNQSFLATIHATLDAADCGEELQGILAWFTQHLTMVAPDEFYAPLLQQLRMNDQFREFAGAFLKSASTGVDGLEVQRTEISKQEFRSLPFEKGDVVNLLEKMKRPEVLTILLPGEAAVLVERADKDRYYKLTMQAAHQHQRGKTTPLRLADESDGTRRLLHLIPALFAPTNAVFFIDEIDRSMHPMLVWKFLEFFLKSHQSSRRQIIVTTHESNLLDLDLLRRDEIWFAEKDSGGATRLYSLADFQVRKDLDIEKGYFQGRFGAVPFLGNLDRLLAQEEAHTK